MQDEMALNRLKVFKTLPENLLPTVDGMNCLPFLGLQSRVFAPACFLRSYRHRFAASIDSSIPKRPKRRWKMKYVENSTRENSQQ